MLMFLIKLHVLCICVCINMNCVTRPTEPVEGSGSGCVHPHGAGRLLVRLRSDQEVQRRHGEADEGPGGSAEGRAEPAGAAGEVSPSQLLSQHLLLHSRVNNQTDQNYMCSHPVI